MNLGLEFPSYAGWISHARENLATILDMNIDILVLITEYGSSLYIAWKDKVGYRGVVPLERIEVPDVIPEIPIILRPHINILLTCRIDDTHIDLLSDHTWHVRNYMKRVCQHQTGIPHDACIVSTNRLYFVDDIHTRDD